ncbi:histamine N-methyltransferase [Pelobates cultripes]|nr:histamine N-methyltransferase [Pelobates cultripes]
MASVMKSLYLDKSRYVEAFRLYIKTSTEHQSMLQFINTKLPEIISSIGNEKSSLNILGIGSGSGEIDLQIISKLQVSHPDTEVNNDIVEPSDEQTIKYKERIGKQSGFDNVTFSWYKKTCQEYESQVTNDKQNKKYDLIHMIQVFTETKQSHCSSMPLNTSFLPVTVAGSRAWWLWRYYPGRLPLYVFFMYVPQEKSFDVSLGMFRHPDHVPDYEVRLVATEVELLLAGDDAGKVLRRGGRTSNKHSRRKYFPSLYNKSALAATNANRGTAGREFSDIPGGYLYSCESEEMEATMRSLLSDNSRYVEAFRLFLKNSTEHQCMQDFINTKLPEIISSLGIEKPAIDVLGIGSGSGEIDLQMISKIQVRYPGIQVNNNIVEPSPEQILSYKERVAKAPGLDNVLFTWHKKTSHEFEIHVNETKQHKKYDFIHMIQMLYYVKDVSATLKFVSSCLSPNGKLLIILVSGNSGWSHLWKKYGSHLPLNDLCLYVTASDIQNELSSMRAKFQSYDLHSEMDITECFVDGDRNGELLLDFLTETCEFKKYAPSDLRDQILHDLKSPECSSTKDGKIVFNNNLSVIVVENQ